MFLTTFDRILNEKFIFPACLSKNTNRQCGYIEKLELGSWYKLVKIKCIKSNSNEFKFTSANLSKENLFEGLETRNGDGQPLTKFFSASTCKNTTTWSITNWTFLRRADFCFCLYICASYITASTCHYLPSCPIKDLHAWNKHLPCPPKFSLFLQLENPYNPFLRIPSPKSLTCTYYIYFPIVIYEMRTNPVLFSGFTFSCIFSDVISFNCFTSSKFLHHGETTKTTFPVQFQKHVGKISTTSLHKRYLSTSSNLPKGSVYLENMKICLVCMHSILHSLHCYHLSLLLLFLRVLSFVCKLVGSNPMQTLARCYAPDREEVCFIEFHGIFLGFPSHLSKL